MSIYWVLNALALVAIVLMVLGIAALLVAIVWILYYEIQDMEGDDDE